MFLGCCAAELNYLMPINIVFYSIAERYNWAFFRKCRAQDKVAGHGAAGSTA